MNRLKLYWFGAVFLVLGVAGLAMSLCGGWFIWNGISTLNMSPLAWGLMIGVLPGAVALYVARDIYRWITAEWSKRNSDD
jgi:hypothetical protein